MTSDRFASISTLLPARSGVDLGAQQTDQPEPSPASSSAASSSPVPVSPRPTPRRVTGRSRDLRQVDKPARTRASDAAHGGTRRVAFRLDPALHQQLSERAARTRASKGNVVLDAIENAHAAGALTPVEAAPARTGMFSRTQDRGPASATVLVEIRLTSQAVQTLDQLVERTRQPTRTQLIHAALAHHFSTREDSGR